MDNFTKILTTIRRPFQQELRKGCKDDVVINGLGNYVQLWVKNGDAFVLDATQKEMLNGLANLFENYGGISPTERQRTLEEATKRIDDILRKAPQSFSTEGSPPTRPEPTTQRTSAKKNGQQTEMLPLFEKRENPPERVPIKQEQTVEQTPDAKQTESLPLFQNVEAPPQHVESTPTEEAAESVPIPDTPVGTDITTLDFLGEPLQYLKGIGPRRASMLREELSLQTVGEFLAYYPRDYIDRSKMVEIYRVGRREDDEPETIQGKVVSHTSSPTAKGKRIGKVSIFDGTGVAMLVNFGRRIGVMKGLLPVDTEVVVSGKFTRRYNEIQATDYEFELFEEGDETQGLIHTKRIVPKYPLTAKLTAKMMRMWMRTALDEYGQQIPEILPLTLRQRQGLIDRQSAINEIHFPTSEAHRKAAQKRLAFEEFFLLSLGMEMKKEHRTSEDGIAFQVGTETGENVPPLLRDFIASLPYQLTNAQKRVFAEIQDDMRKKNVMNRLIQGDVGSGKTVVAAMALLCAIENGYQGALMVPTEILAEQHYYNLSEMLEHLHKTNKETTEEDGGKINVVLLKSDLPKAEREEALEAITNGSADLIVGTQALTRYHRRSTSVRRDATGNTP